MQTSDKSMLQAYIRQLLCYKVMPACCLRIIVCISFRLCLVDLVTTGTFDDKNVNRVLRVDDNKEAELLAEFEFQKKNF